MKLISVNIGKEQIIRKGKRNFSTGIYKFPADDPVQVGSLGIADDVICDKNSHGGLDQAIYVYGMADYMWWEKELGHPVDPGTFGDNFSISELESAGFMVGDFINVGPVTLQVTSPRIPCSTLAARMGDPSFKQRFRKAARPGLYCRVIRTGQVQAGDSVTIQSYTGETISVFEMFRDYYKTNLTEETLRRYLSAPIGERDLVYYEKRLEKVLRLRT